MLSSLDLAVTFSMPNVWEKARLTLAREAAEREEAARKAEEDKSIQKALHQTAEEEEEEEGEEEEEKKRHSGRKRRRWWRKGNDKSSSSRRRRYYYPSSDEEGCSSSSEYYSSSPPRRHRRRNIKCNKSAIRRRPQCGRRSGKIEKAGVKDYLGQGKNITEILEMNECPKIYPLLRKRYQRSVHTALKEMADRKNGSLYPHMSDQEREVLQKNEAAVRAALADEEMTANPFEGSTRDLAKTVANVIFECHDE